MIKNVFAYRVSPEWKISPEKLAEQLARAPFVPCKSKDEKTRGWGERNGALLTSMGGCHLIELRCEQKLLPSKVIKQEVEKKAKVLEGQQGFAPGRKQLKEIKEMVRDELLARAFATQSVTTAWFDMPNRMLFVEASGTSAADAVVEALRMSLDELPLTMLHTQVSPSSFMIDMLNDGEPAGFTVDRECELVACGEEKASVKYAKHALDGNDIGGEIRAHLASGKMPKSLAMTYDDRLSFVLDEKFFIKKIALLDLVKEEQGDADDQADRFMADFALMSAEISKVVLALIGAMGGEVKES